MPARYQVLGPSGAGKTLTLELAVHRLRRRGVRVAVVKRSDHPLDVPGKDTDRLRRAGANVVVFASEGSVLFSSWDAEKLSRALPVDVVLVEGFRRCRGLQGYWTVARPGDAPRIAAEIDGAVGRPAPPPSVRADRRRRLTGDAWETVANLMRAARVHRIELVASSAPRPARRRLRALRSSPRAGRPARRT